MEIITDKEELKKRVDLVEFIGEYVGLKKIGNSYCGFSPVNNEKHESFYVFRGNGNWFWKDFSGGNLDKTGGDVFDFWQYAVEPGCSFQQALRGVASKLGVIYAKTEEDIKKQKEMTAIEKLLQKYQDILVSNLLINEKALEYLKRRSLEKITITKQQLGFSTKKDIEILKKEGYSQEEIAKAGILNKFGFPLFQDRITIPIKNNGKIVSFGGRSISEEEKIKYLNSLNTEIYQRAKNLYSPIVSERISLDYIIICEGFFDAIALAEAGYRAYAILGTEATKEQIEKMYKLSTNIVLMLDGDKPGQSKTKKIAFSLVKLGAEVKIVTLPDNKDPDEFLDKSTNEENNLKLIEYMKKNALTVFDWILKSINADFETLKGRKEILKNIKQYLSITNEVEKDWYTKELAEKMNIPLERLRKEFYPVLDGNTSKVSEELLNPSIFQPKSNEKIYALEEKLLRIALKENSINEILKIFIDKNIYNLAKKLIDWKNSNLSTEEINFVLANKSFVPSSNKEQLLKEHTSLILHQELLFYKNKILQIENKLKNER